MRPGLLATTLYPFEKTFRNSLGRLLRRAAFAPRPHYPRTLLQNILAAVHIIIMSV